MSSSETPHLAGEVTRQTEALRVLVDALLASGEVVGVPAEAVQQGMTALVKLYAALWDAGARFAPVATDDGVTATAAMVLATGLLKAVRVELFELGMWQAWADR